MTHKFLLLSPALLLISTMALASGAHTTPASLCAGLSASNYQSCLSIAAEKQRTKQASDAKISTSYDASYQAISQSYQKQMQAATTKSTSAAKPASSATSTATTSTIHKATTQQAPQAAPQQATTPAIIFHPNAPSRSTTSQDKPSTSTTSPTRGGFHIAYD